MIYCIYADKGGEIMEKFVITVNRCCGSNGASVARKVAETLGIGFYDRDLIDLASEQSGISLDLFAAADERVKNSLLTRISSDEYDGTLITPESDDFDDYQKLFDCQADVIRNLAKKESCVIVGRCADFVLLNEDVNLVRVFVGARDHTCVQNEMKRLSITNKQAKERINKINTYRKEYYHHHTGRRWNSARNYDLCISTTVLSADECADIIIQYLNKTLKKD